MNHSDIQSMMADYLDGTLALEKRALFDGHLDQCDECTGDLAEMRATIQLLRGLPDPEPPADLVPNVMRRIREGEARPGFLERLGELAALLLTPKVAVPVTAMAAGVLVMVFAGDGRAPLPGFGSKPTVTASLPASRSRSDTAGERSEPIANSSFATAPVKRANPTEGQAPSRSLAQVVAEIEGPFEPAGESVADPSVIRFTEGRIGPLRRDTDATDMLFAERSPQRPPIVGAGSVPLAEPGRLVPVSTDPQPAAKSNAGSLFEGGYSTAAPPQSSTELPDWSGGLGELPKADRRLIELDRILTRVIADPIEYSHRLQQATLAERELWLKNLAQRALETGREVEVIEALRSAGSPVASQVANEFAGTVARVIASAETTAVEAD